MTTKIETYGQLLEKIRKLEAERDALREQLEAAERSAREMHIAADRFLRERDALRAENERLKAQLQAVFDQLDRDLGSPREGVLSDLRRSYAAS